MFRAVEVKALPNYRLWVRFEDGVTGEVDLSNDVGKGVFALWNDPDEFSKVTLGSSGEPRWNDKIDICPDAIYMQITGKTREQLFPNLTQQVDARA